MEKKKVPNPKAFLTNLKTDLPWREKLRRLIRNNWVKLRHLQSCCGHPGEPGC